MLNFLDIWEILEGSLSFLNGVRFANVGLMSVRTQTARYILEKITAIFIDQWAYCIKPIDLLRLLLEFNISVSTVCELFLTWSYDLGQVTSIIPGLLPFLVCTIQTALSLSIIWKNSPPHCI